MNVLLLGNTGQLGWELNRTLQPLGTLVALDHPQIDMADPDSIRKTVRDVLPDLIVNATAYTAVDKAESEPELANAINGLGPGVLAEEARKLQALLIHYSTDYVFDGAHTAPYCDTDLPNPINEYGRSKLAGEQAIQAAQGHYLIFRTAWVYSLRRDSFVSKVMGWARRNEVLRVVDDQVSNPTWARMLAEATSLVLARGSDYVRERTGLYHLAGAGFASRYAWAHEILRLDPAKQEHRLKQLLTAVSSEFPTPALRPLFSALDCQKFIAVFGFALPPWKTALELALAP
jgi:dTDP-4-dehydrorhamnose reductase